MTAYRICPACGLEDAAPGDRYCAGCSSADDPSAWADSRSCGCPWDGHLADCPIIAPPAGDLGDFDEMAGWIE